jgi:hypothetical protein
MPITFRYPSRVSTYLFSGICIFVAVTLWIVCGTRPESVASIPSFVWLFLLTLSGFALYGVRIRTLEITVDGKCYE